MRCLLIAWGKRMEKVPTIRVITRTTKKINNEVGIRIGSFTERTFFKILDILRTTITSRLQKNT